MSDPLIDIAVRVITRATSDLVHQGRRADAGARANGFINAEHDVLAFLASRRFRDIIDFILPYKHGEQPPLEWAQAILDRAYGGLVTIDPMDKLDAAPVPLRRLHQKPHNGKDLSRSIVQGRRVTVLQLLREYDRIVIEEQWRQQLPRWAKELRAGGGE